jgi:hypothetical protein
MIEERAAGGLNERIAGTNRNIFGVPTNGKAEVKLCKSSILAILAMTAILEIKWLI